MKIEITPKSALEILNHADGQGFSYSFERTGSLANRNIIELVLDSPDWQGPKLRITLTPRSSGETITVFTLVNYPAPGEE